MQKVGRMGVLSNACSLVVVLLCPEEVSVVDANKRVRFFVRAWYVHSRTSLKNMFLATLLSPVPRLFCPASLISP